MIYVKPYINLLTYSATTQELTTTSEEESLLIFLIFSEINVIICLLSTTPENYPLYNLFEPAPTENSTTTTEEESRMSNSLHILNQISSKTYSNY